MLLQIGLIKGGVNSDMNINISKIISTLLFLGITNYALMRLSELVELVEEVFILK